MRSVCFVILAAFLALDGIAAAQTEPTTSTTPSTSTKKPAHTSTTQGATPTAPQTTTAKTTTGKAATSTHGDTQHSSSLTSHPASNPASHPTSHSVSHPAAGSTAQKSKSSKGKRSSKQAKKHGQQAIDPTRTRQIQEALIREHYMDGEPSGSWDAVTQAAMQRYQADQGWQSKTTPDSRALIKLGLGPSHDHLLNPESAMTAAPGDPKAAAKPASAQTNIPQQ
ncbi:MAG: peptidoglycan-binding domain-containing protein [Terriglobales bacterium]